MMSKGQQVQSFMPALFHADGYAADRRPKGDPGNSVLEATLELVDWKKVEQVTDDGAVMKKTLLESKEWIRPNEEATVKLELVGRLQDGTIFDDRGQSQPVDITLDAGDHISTLCRMTQRWQLLHSAWLRARIECKGSSQRYAKLVERSGWMSCAVPLVSLHMTVGLLVALEAGNKAPPGVPEPHHDM